MKCIASFLFLNVLYQVHTPNTPVPEETPQDSLEGFLHIVGKLKHNAPSCIEDYIDLSEIGSGKKRQLLSAKEIAIFNKWVEKGLEGELQEVNYPEKISESLGGVKMATPTISAVTTQKPLSTTSFNQNEILITLRRFGIFPRIPDTVNEWISAMEKAYHACYETGSLEIKKLEYLKEYVDAFMFEYREKLLKKLRQSSAGTPGELKSDIRMSDFIVTDIETIFQKLDKIIIKPTNVRGWLNIWNLVDQAVKDGKLTSDEALILKGWVYVGWKETIDANPKKPKIASSHDQKLRASDFSITGIRAIYTTMHRLFETPKSAVDWLSVLALADENDKRGILSEVDAFFLKAWADAGREEAALKAQNLQKQKEVKKETLYEAQRVQSRGQYQTVPSIISHPTKRPEESALDTLNLSPEPVHRTRKISESSEKYSSSKKQVTTPPS